MNKGRPNYESPTFFEKYRIITTCALAFFITIGALFVQGRLRSSRLAGILTSNGNTVLFHSRVRTGLQRADDIAFFANGSRLAISSPRYPKFTLWSGCELGIVAPKAKTFLNPSLIKTINLEGHPQRLVPYKDFMIIIERPPGDDRHVKPGFYEVFDKDGVRMAGPVDIGWEPDDMSLVERDSKLYGLILLSGNAEGAENRPNPSVKIVEIDPDTFKIQELRDIEMMESKSNNEDPLRIIAGKFEDSNEQTKHVAMVTLGRNGAVRKLNWTDLNKPFWQWFSAIPDADPAGAAMDAKSGHLLTFNSNTGRLLRWPLSPLGNTIEEIGDGVHWSALQSIPGEPGFEIAAISEQEGLFGIGDKTFRQFKLRGPYGYGTVHPTGIAVHAFAPNHYFIAICDRTGGLHWSHKLKPVIIGPNSVTPVKTGPNGITPVKTEPDGTTPVKTEDRLTPVKK